jgi:hypothetical protein
MMDREAFLSFVEEYIRNDPETAAHIGQRVQNGISRALREQKEKSSDMECALAVALERKSDRRIDLIRQKIQKWVEKGMNSLNWDSYLEGEDHGNQV